MSIYLDRKYLLLTQARLQQFKQKANDLYNFRCPFCGDSKKNKLKSRGYIYRAQYENGYGYRCWNCNISTNFTTFLKFLDIVLYKDYIMEKFEDENTTQKLPVEAPTLEFVEGEIVGGVKIQEINLPTIASLSDDHYAKTYIAARKIPEDRWDQLFYAHDFKLFMDTTFPNHGKENLIENDPRIVMFYTDLAGNITCVNGRSFSADPKLRYVKIKILDHKKIFGLERVDFGKKFYIVEGEFDSMFLENAVASGDANLSGAAAWIYDTFGVRGTLVFDKEPRNLQLVEIIDKSIEEMWDVSILPEYFPGKDINEAFLKGVSVKQIQDIIDQNTYSGLVAKLQLSSWRKC
jgi:hypothetical protein